MSKPPVAESARTTNDFLRSMELVRSDDAADRTLSDAVIPLGLRQPRHSAEHGRADARRQQQIACLLSQAHQRYGARRGNNQGTNKLCAERFLKHLDRGRHRLHDADQLVAKTTQTQAVLQP